MIVLESLLANVFLVLFLRLVRLIELLLQLSLVIRSSYYSGDLGLIGVNLLGQMGWFVAWSVSSDLNSSALVISCELRNIVLLIRLVLSRFVFNKLLRINLAILDLILILTLRHCIVLVSYYSIRNSWLSVSLDLTLGKLGVGLLDILPSSVRLLVNHSLTL